MASSGPMGVDMHGLLAVALLTAALVGGAAAFAFEPYRRQDTSGRTLDNKRETPEPNFHEVARRIGKTVLRPGGSEATRKIQALANISKGVTVLELSAGLGRSGIEMAQRYGAKVTVTDIDTLRLEKAKQYADNLGLSDLVSVKEVDMFDIDSGLGPESKFNVAQTEASLTHHPRSRKKQFFEGVAKHADRFILHEVYFKTDDEGLQEKTKKDLSKVLTIGFAPETSESWQKLLTDAGFTIEQVVTGDLAVLNPLSVIKDEGWGFAKIAFNLITQPYLRARMLATKREMIKHANELGYITIVASK